MARNKGRIVVVGPLPPPFTGQSVSFQMLVDGLAERAIAHVIVDIAGGEVREGTGFSWRRLAEYARVLPTYLWKTLGERSTVYVTIAQSRYGFFRDAVMILWASLMRHRVVVHLKGGNYGAFYASQPRLMQYLIRVVLRRTTRVIVLGERLREMFAFDPRVAAKVKVVLNGLPFASPSRAIRRVPDGSSPIRLLFLSNLIESKGYFDVISAVSDLRHKHGLDVVVDFCGEFCSYVDDVRVRSSEHARALFFQTVRAAGVEDRVFFRGLVTGEVKHRYLSAAHFFVLPTRYCNEGQPVSIIEAMAYGLVVISTDYRAIPDMVIDGVTGRLVPYGDPHAMAAAINELVASPNTFAQMSEKAISRYESLFTKEKHLDRLLQELVPDPHMCDLA